MKDYYEEGFDTNQVEGLLDRGIVVHWSEEVFSDGQDHNFFKEAISHHELFCCTRDVSVVMEDSHCRVASDMRLQNDV